MTDQPSPAKNLGPTGWFEIPGIQSGVRLLKKQIKGLQLLTADIAGKSIVDFGAAEGLIGKYYLDLGARLYHGVELVPERVALGNELLAQYPEARLFCADLEHFEVWRQRSKALLPRYDVVLLLSIVQKFAHPKRFLEEAARLSRDWVAIRTPQPVIQDPRSRYIAVDVERTLIQLGFYLVCQGPSGESEWLGLFRRRH